MAKIRCKQVNSAGLRVFMGTLTNGANVHEALTQTAVTHYITTATFELLGGLNEVTFTAYDFEQQTRQEPTVLKQPLEIVSGHGTISLLDDHPHVHLHLSVSFRDAAYPHGIGLVGGHAASAAAFAVEFTLMAYDGKPMRRVLDVGTGLKLWR
ncbi:PPC domain-containing DNA-binding protein [Candidatus Leptofilum sp.]|uniref:PPC domain-containing DNA-binding protein n=1 Tax=Candidatus Leptofilum sp. TaxID=3241576 RepID=UPI003B593F6C